LFFILFFGVRQLADGVLVFYAKGIPLEVAYFFAINGNHFQNNKVILVLSKVEIWSFSDCYL